MKRAVAPATGIERRGSNLAIMLGLAGAIGAAAAATTSLDGWLGKKKWPSSPLELVGDPTHSDAMITFSGLGSMGGADQSAQVTGIFKKPGLYWNYSTDGFSVGAMASRLRTEMSGLRTIGVNGHSMGGPTGLEVVRQAKLQDAKLGPVVLHCSPFDFRDGRNHRVAKVLDLVRMPTGPVSKATFTLARSALEGTLSKGSFGEALTNAVSGCSPRLWMAQMRTLNGLDLASNAHEYGGLVGEQTEVWYCRPADPEQDRTVDTMQASERYGEFFGALGVPYHIVEVPEAGHADVTRACAQLALAVA